MGSIVVFARLLMPEHFGLISMVTAVTTIAERFKDLGLDTATIQRQHITHEQVSTLFWINVAIGTFIMMLVAGVSPLIAWFYGDTRLLWISLALASTFFFGGLTIQHQALLRRQMHFARLGWIEVLATALSTALAIVLAWQGFKYWSLVWKEVSRAAFITLGTWLMCRWVPGLPMRTSGISSMLQVGKYITGFNIIYFFSRNLDQILIGKFCGPNSAGLYRQAYQLIYLPVYLLHFPLDYVMMPALSALQGEPGRYRRYYKKAVSVLAFYAMPLIAYLAVFSESLVHLVLGAKWIASATIFRILAIAYFIQPVAITCGTVMVSCGKAKTYFWWGVLHSICVVCAFCLGIYWGPTGVATAYLAYSYATLLPSLWFSFRKTPIPISLFFKSISLPALSSIIMGLLLTTIRYTFRPLDTLTEIGLSLLVAPSLYFGVWLLLPTGKTELIEHLAFLRLACKSLPSLFFFRKTEEKVVLENT
jgi:PST family polysaccharide transporter